MNPITMILALALIVGLMAATRNVGARPLVAVGGFGRTSVNTMYPPAARSGAPPDMRAVHTNQSARLNALGTDTDHSTDSINTTAMMRTSTDSGGDMAAKSAMVMRR